MVMESYLSKKKNYVYGVLLLKFNNAKIWGGGGWLGNEAGV